MKTITNEWVCGNVAVKATLDLPECVEEGSGHAVLMREGMTQILQRKPSSVWEKAEAGYEKRPEGFKRNSIPFSTASATALVGEFTKALPKDVKVLFETSEHVPGETGDAKPTKEAQDDWVKMQALPEEKFRANCKLIGLDAEDYDDESGVKALHAFYLKAKREAAEAARLASKGKLSM